MLRHRYEDRFCAPELMRNEVELRAFLTGNQQIEFLACKRSQGCGDATRAVEAGHQAANRFQEISVARSRSSRRHIGKTEHPFSSIQNFVPISL